MKSLFSRKPSGYETKDYEISSKHFCPILFNTYITFIRCHEISLHSLKLVICIWNLILFLQKFCAYTKIIHTIFLSSLFKLKKNYSILPHFAKRPTGLSQHSKFSSESITSPDVSDHVSRQISLLSINWLEFLRKIPDLFLVAFYKVLNSDYTFLKTVYF